MAVVAGDEGAGDGGVADGAVLRRFALAVVGDADDDELAGAREAAAEAVGPAGLGDTCGVIANFDGITRVADATGTEIDQTMRDGIDAGLLGGFDTSSLRVEG